MESKEKYFKSKALSIAQQLVKIQYDYSNFMCKTESNSTLIILGKIKPTPLSCYYKVRIEYKIGNRPNIFIVSPQLRFNNIKIPHTYKDNELCLFYPKYKEWTKYDYISDKIIPWISEWLYFYEIWCITGSWVGGGKHPSKNKRKLNTMDRHVNNL